MKTLLCSLSALVCFTTLSLAQNPGAPADTLKERASKLVIPKIDFREATVPEVIDFLRLRAREIGPEEGGGVNVILTAAEVLMKRGPVAPPPPPGGLSIPGLDAVPAQPAALETRITLTLNKVPLFEVFRYVANLADLGLRVDEHAVVFTSKAAGKEGVEPVPRPAIHVTPGKGGEKLLAEFSNQPIKIPMVSFRESTIREVCEFLQLRAKSLAPDAKPLNIILKLDEGKPLRPVTFTAKDLPVLDAIRYAAEIAGTEITAEEFALVISSPKTK